MLRKQIMETDNNSLLQPENIIIIFFFKVPTLKCSCCVIVIILLISNVKCLLIAKLKCNYLTFFCVWTACNVCIFNNKHLERSPNGMCSNISQRRVQLWLKNLMYFNILTIGIFLSAYLPGSYFIKLYF